MKLRYFFFALLCVIVCLPLYAQLPLPRNFEQGIRAGMSDWEIPGLAIAIVKDGSVFYARGFGEKKLGTGDVVDEHTLFGIASVSKNITAAALGILVDEGKLAWNDRVVDIIPWFALSDPWVTQQVTVKDLLTHQVGIGRVLGNRLQFMTRSPRDEVIRQLPYMDFEQPFRSGFVYSNVMYSVAGQLIEYITGITWDDFLKERLFKPLGMGSNTSITEIRDGDNVAWPHQYIDGQVIPIPRRNWDNAGPAGGINASVVDVAQWLILQMGEPGMYNGQRIISARQMGEIHRPHVIRSGGDPYGAQQSYGLGWNVSDYQGKRVLSHGGATDGFNTAAYIVPEINLGVVVVGNTFNQLGDALAYTVMDAFLGVKGNDWQKHYLDRYRANFEQATEQRANIHQSRVQDTRPTLEESAYLGSYRSQSYGEVVVKQGAHGLELHFWGDESLIADLEHWHYDTFRAVWRNRAQREEFMNFQLGRSGAVAFMEFEFVLRPLLLQVGAYPSNYTRNVKFEKQRYL